MAEVFEAFYLSGWYVDVGANRLCRGNTEVKLEAKVMAVLSYLAQHKGELVTRETLEREIWGDTVVGYDALTSCIAKLRKILGDDSRHPQFIETISKKGYRLIGDVTPGPAGMDDAALVEEAAATFDVPVALVEGKRRRSLQWVFAAIGISMVVLLGIVYAIMQWMQLNEDEKQKPVLLIQDRPSLVVLPFTNIGGKVGQDYFSEGITADITTALSKLSGLFVIAQFSAEGFEGTAESVKQVANSLGARYVLQGSVMRSENRLRINVHLVDVTSDIYLWSEKYDRELHNVFDVQDDITANIVNSLSITLTEEEKRRTALRYTTSIEAYDDFLRGRSMFNHNTREDNLVAREYYQRAIDRDSHFARAYSGMAMTYVLEHRYGWATNPRARLGIALELARKGVALDDELPHAHWVLAHVNLFRQAYREAAESAQRAIELEPNFADSYVTLAVCKMHFGESEEALRLVRKAILLNPKYPAAYVSIRGQIHFFLGEYEEAVPILREAAEMNMNLLNPHIFLIVTLSMLGRDDEAHWEAEQLKILAPNFTADNVAEILPLHDAVVIEEMQKHLQRAGF